MMIKVRIKEHVIHYRSYQINDLTKAMTSFNYAYIYRISD